MALPHGFEDSKEMTEALPYRIIDQSRREILRLMGLVGAVGGAAGLGTLIGMSLGSNNKPNEETASREPIFLDQREVYEGSDLCIADWNEGDAINSIDVFPNTKMSVKIYGRDFVTHTKGGKVVAFTFKYPLEKVRDLLGLRPDENPPEKINKPAHCVLLVGDDGKQVLNFGNLGYIVRGGSLENGDAMPESVYMDYVKQMQAHLPQGADRDYPDAGNYLADQRLKDVFMNFPSTLDSLRDPEDGEQASLGLTRAVTQERLIGYIKRVQEALQPTQEDVVAQ